MIRFFLLLLISISIFGCASRHSNRLLVTKIEYRKGDDGFNSQSKIFTREMCSTDDVRVRIGISDIQIEQVGDIAEMSGFFDISRHVVWPQQKCIDIGLESSLTIVRGKKRNTMSWTTSCNGGYPSQLSDTLKLLDEMIYNDKKVKGRPLANCARL